MNLLVPLVPNTSESLRPWISLQPNRGTRMSYLSLRNSRIIHCIFSDFQSRLNVSFSKTRHAFKIIYERAGSISFHSTLPFAHSEVNIVVDYWLFLGIPILEICFLNVNDDSERTKTWLFQKCVAK